MTGTPNTDSLLQIKNHSHKKLLRIGAVCGVVFVVTAFSYIRSLNVPSQLFPVGVDIIIEDGLSESSIAKQLESARVIRSKFLFSAILKYRFESKFLLAGTYRFDEPLTTQEVVQSLTEGLHTSPTLKLVLPEGFSAKNFYNLLPGGYVPKQTPDVEALEGYLFPDTYHITHTMNIDTILELLQETMMERLNPYTTEILQSGFTVHELLTLASIVEREANDEESMGLVSGILQDRLKIGMALQVDATLDYVLDKTSAELTADDLVLDSPFNTYKYRGLPPHPIANPGIMAIEAVLYPTPSPYMFYLTGDDGVFYYAKDFEEHKRNKEKYLR